MIDLRTVSKYQDISDNTLGTAKHSFKRLLASISSLKIMALSSKASLSHKLLDMVTDIVESRLDSCKFEYVSSTGRTLYNREKNAQMCVEICIYDRKHLSRRCKQFWRLKMCNDKM